MHRQCRSRASVGRHWPRRARPRRQDHGHGLGVAQTFNRHHDERIGIVFPEGILGLKLDEEAFAGEAALKRSLELREDVAVPVQIGEPLGARFLKNLPDMSAMRTDRVTSMSFLTASAMFSLPAALSSRLFQTSPTRWP